MTWAILLTCCQTFGQSTFDDQFLEGLRSRRLFELAERLCRMALDDEQLPAARQAEWNVQLARTLAERALQTEPSQRAKVWQSAHAVCHRFLDNHAEGDFQLLVRLQDALVWLAQGELARQEAEFLPDRPDRFDEAQRRLFRAVRQLADLEAQAEIALREAYRRPPDKRNQPGQPQQLTTEQLTALTHDITFHMARARLNQAQCYPRASADWTNSLSAALEQFSQLAEMPYNEPRVWRSRVLRVRTLRFMGRLKEAQTALKAIETAKAPSEIDQRARAERLRLLLAADRVDDAMRQVKTDTSRVAPPEAEVDSARFDVLLAAWRAAQRRNDQPRAEELATQATEQVRLIERRHGPYWMRWAESRLAENIAGDAHSSSAATLRRAAESYFRGGQIDASLAAYDRAYEAAERNANSQTALELGVSAAAVAQHANRLTDALDRYRRTALAREDLPQSAEAHQQAIVVAAQLARQVAPAARPASLARYVDLLHEHLKHWPSSPTTNRINEWLGAWSESRRDWAAAAACYEAIRADYEEYEKAISSSARCRERQLAVLRSAGESTRGPALAAAERFESQIAPQGQWASVDSWDGPKRLCALAAASIRLRYTSDGAPGAEKLLSAALGDTSGADPAWIARARTLRVLALAQLGRFDQASAMLRQANSLDADQLVELLDDLKSLLSGEDRAQDQTVLAATAQLALEVDERVKAHSTDLTAAEQSRYQQARAAALAAADQTDEALREYDQLIERNPTDAALRLARAELLLASDQLGRLRLALDAWRDLEKHSRQGGQRWLRSRLGQAETLLRLGRNEEAARLIRLTQALHPELGGEEIKQRFSEVLAQCK